MGFEVGLQPPPPRVKIIQWQIPSSSYSPAETIFQLIEKKAVEVRLKHLRLLSDFDLGIQADFLVH